MSFLKEAMQAFVIGLFQALYCLWVMYLLLCESGDVSVKALCNGQQVERKEVDNRKVELEGERERESFVLSYG